MRAFLNDYIDTLPEGSRVRASVLLRQAALEREEVAILIQKITQDLSLGDISFSSINPGSFTRVSGSTMLVNFRELLLRIDLFYRISTNISDLLNSETVTVLSEIKELEQELDAIDKSIKNYSFLLSDGNAFDFGFMEPFSDEINRATDIDFVIPDRAGLSFSVDQKARINRSEGVLTLSPLTTTTVPYTATISAHNYGGRLHASADSEISNISLSGIDTAWKVSVSSASPINSTLSDIIGQHGVSTYSGVQAVLDLFIDEASPCDFITINPLADSDIDVIQITTYSDDMESDPIELLDAVLTIHRPTTLFFEVRPIRRISIYLRQGTYRRHNHEPMETERLYRRVYKDHRSRGTFNNKRQSFKIRNISGLSQIFVKNFLRKSRDLEPLSVRVSNKRLELNRWGPLDARLDIARDVDTISTRPDWFRKEPIDQVIKATYDAIQVTDHLVPAVFKKRNETSRRVNPYFTYFSNHQLKETIGFRSFFGRGQANAIYGRIRRLQSIQNSRSTQYHYSFGLNNVTCGVRSQVDKGVFVSKQMPSSGDIIQLKMKEAHTNTKLTFDPTLDSTIASSVEYSITNVARPYLEEHWIPILPNNKTEIVSERILLDDKGKAFFRFPAEKREDIVLYKNNRLFSLQQVDLIHSEGDTNIIGFILDVPAFSPTDIFTVDYIPYGNANLIDFKERGFVDTPRVVSFDSSGAGEGFSKTEGQLTISLENHPYIDYDQVDTSTYSSTTGLSPYVPITIVLSDGSNAINLTNYKGGAQSALSSGSSSVQFIHRGNSLLFNKAIDSPFRVFYEYLPGNVRVRIVLRSNAQTGLVSPSVDFVHIKAKTRVADAKAIS